MSKLGTNSKSAVARVQSEERANEIMQICEEKNWKVIVGIEPDKEEDISDIYKLLGYKVEKIKTIVRGEKVGRNEPCPCGNGSYL
ncbi:MAG: hypothetical protein MJA82_02705 [Clostridia bacterium]|nr:hypothetical protein [Clostridia bacterium]